MSVVTFGYGGASGQLATTFGYGFGYSIKCPLRANVSARTMSMDVTSSEISMDVTRSEIAMDVTRLETGMSITISEITCEAERDTCS